MYKRWAHSALIDALQSHRIALLSGARQCGKTTLVRTLDKIFYEYRSLDDLTLLKAAESDPQDFVRTQKKTLIIDEIQRVPDLLLAMKYIVDQNPQKGQFLLAGSANIQTLPSVQESLAGRIASVRLRTLSQGEILNTSPIFIPRAFQREFSTPSYHYGKNDLIQIALRGGYPEVLEMTAQHRKKWHLSYINAIISRDLQYISNLQRKNDLHNLIHVLAAWSSKFMNMSSIGSGLSLQRQTLSAYIGALESLYLVERLPGWQKTDYDRIGKQDKLFMADSGFMCSLLNWQEEDIRFDGEKNGKLLETLAYAELMAQRDVYGEEYTVSHYRDRQGREIDFLIENTNGEMVGIEVKSGSTIDKKFFRPMVWFRDNLYKGPRFTGIILYSGEHKISFGDGLYAVPFSALWS